MEYTTDRAKIGSWAPLLTEGRAAVPIAATKMDRGTDVNFGTIAEKLFGWLAASRVAAFASNHRVVDLQEASGGLGCQHPRSRHRGDPSQPRQVRLRRRRRRQSPSPPEIRHRRSPRSWRLPDRRPMARVRQPRDRPTPSGQGLRSGARRRTHDGRATPRLPHSRRQEDPPLRPVRRVDDQVPPPQGQCLGSPRLGEAHNLATLLKIGASNLPLREIPRAARHAEHGRPHGGAPYFLSQRQSLRLEARSTPASASKRSRRPTARPASSITAPKSSPTPSAPSPHCSAPRPAPRSACTSCSRSSSSASRNSSPRPPAKPASRK